jgi:glutamate formiminotransferase
LNAYRTFPKAEIKKYAQLDFQYAHRETKTKIKCLKVIDAIANAIAHTKGCYLLDVDSGVSTNRTIYTFVGEPECVVQGALAAARVAHRLIDMQVQKGEHPRIGFSLIIYYYLNK